MSYSYCLSNPSTLRCLNNYKVLYFQSITCYYYFLGVGKTSLVIRNMGGGFTSSVTPTIGASFFSFTVWVSLKCLCAKTYKCKCTTCTVHVHVCDTVHKLPLTVHVHVCAISFFFNQMKWPLCVFSIIDWTAWTFGLMAHVWANMRTDCHACTCRLVVC